MVTNFLNFARPERVSLQPLDLEAVVRRGVADVDAGGEHVDVTGRFGEVDGDDVLLRQAFSNLVRNALEACRGAGIVPRVAVHGEVLVSDETVAVTVTDNGPGLPEGDRDRLFQPFFTTRADGTGLGLALVQKFVVTHNGHVRAWPMGRVFTVHLPLRPAAPRRSQIPPAAAAVRGAVAPPPATVSLRA